MGTSLWLRDLVEAVRQRGWGPQQQLQFPFADGDLASWSVSTPGPGTARLACSLSAKGGELRLSLPGAAHAGEHDGPNRIICSAAVQVARPASVSLKQQPGSEVLQGLLRAVLGEQDEPQTVVTELSREIGDAIFRCTGRLDAGLVRPFTESLSCLVNHLRALVVPGAVLAAVGFESTLSTRWFIYEALVNDPGGRVLQLTHSCPGVLLMAAGLREHGAERRSQEILDAAKGGLRLSRLLDLVLEHWQASHRTRPPPGQTAGQRARVRRAGPLVSAHVLWRPPEHPLVPEDIPAEPRGNAHWYMTMAAPCLSDDDRVSGDRGRAFASFCSKRHGELAGEQDTVEAIDAALRGLRDYLVYERRSVSRATSPQKILEASARWHHEQWRASHAPLDPQASLGTEGLSDWQRDGIAVRPIRTVGELHHEGRNMHHCVAAHASLAKAGAVQLFHAEVDGEPLTVMTRRGPRGLVLVEAAGMENRPLSEAERLVLLGWLGEVNRASQRRPQRR